MSFTFKKFYIDDTACGMKVCTDSVLLGAWVQEAETASTYMIVDLGTGSGLLALMCAQRFSQAKIIAVEIDSDACQCAENNFKSSPWNNRISLVNADALNWLPKQPIDLIISNPPYFTSTLISPDTTRAIARHGTSETSKSHKIPFNPISVLHFAAQHLSPSGIVAMVTPAEWENNLIFNGTLHRIYLRRICYVRSSERKPVSRILTQWSCADGLCKKENLTIGDEVFKRLTSEFYL